LRHIVLITTLALAFAPAATGQEQPPLPETWGRYWPDWGHEWMSVSVALNPDGSVSSRLPDNAREKFEYQMAKFKRLFGVQLQQVALYPRLRVHEVISLFGSFYEHRANTDDLIALMGLEDRRNARIAELSGGQAQRLSVALAVVNKPQLVFLDEPSTGMDPQARRNLWDIIEGFKAKGMTVVLTTHYMEEAERLCDRVAVMDHGRIIALDSPNALVRQNFAEDAIEFVSNDGLTEDDLGALASVTSATSQGSAHSVFSSDIPRTMGSLLDLARERGAPLDGMRVRHATLEDVFLKLTGRTLRD